MYIVCPIMWELVQKKYIEGLLFWHGKVELAGLRNFQQASFRYYFRQSYKRGLVGKGIAGSHLWKLSRADPTHLGRAQERQMRHFPILAGEKKFRILERL